MILSSDALSNPWIEKIKEKLTGKRDYERRRRRREMRKGVAKLDERLESLTSCRKLTWNIKEKRNINEARED